MAYCPDCGGEVGDGATFCSACGAELETELDGSVEQTIEDGTSETELTTGAGDEEGIQTGRVVVSGLMGVVVGAVVAFAFTNFGLSAVMFVVTLVGVTYFLYSRQETSKLAAGMGMYITALWMPLAPIVFYIPLAGNANTDTASGAGQAIGSVVGMFLYGFIGLILGLVLAAVGYFLRKGERE